MSELSNKSQELRKQIAGAMMQLDLEAKTKELEQLDAEMAAPEVWQDNLRAQKLARQQSKLKDLIEPWQNLQTDIAELISFIEMKDTSLDQENQQKLEALTKEFDRLKEQLKLNGKFDGHDAVVTIQAGAGGTDAQDWAQMLQRMYARWAESHDMKIDLLQESAGEEAGIKSATMIVAGSFAYGKLKSENGVHRLVRQSPFNTAASRETSFAMVEVIPSIDEPEEVEIDDNDLKVDTYRASGHGGQSVNTTDSAVRVTHIPTNIVVSIQNEKSQIQNREVAMKILRSKLAQLAAEQHQDEIKKLKGPNQEAAWGNQIRNYVLHPYKLVKDTRTDTEKSDVDAVLNGDIDDFINAYLEKTLGQ
jgi:peptide chain release factor 2